MSETPEIDVVGGDGRFGAPAPRPCSSCPYRREVPSGVWDSAEYEKLRLYDVEMAMQPPGLFQCHQADADSGARRVCAGWVGCHGPELFGLRFALLDGRLSPGAFEAAANYRSPVPLFGSGGEAADHGQAEIDCPRTDALLAIAKISQRRSDLT